MPPKPGLGCGSTGGHGGWEAGEWGLESSPRARTPGPPQEDGPREQEGGNFWQGVPPEESWYHSIGRVFKIKQTFVNASQGSFICVPYRYSIQVSGEMNEEISRFYLWLHIRRPVFKQNFCYSYVLFLS